MTAVFCTISTDTRLVSSAGELVERIVTADILAQRNEPGVRPPKCCGMDGARLAIELLPRAQCLERLHDLRRREGRLIVDARQGAHGLLKAFDPT
jgi:hypothetical protein